MDLAFYDYQISQQYFIASRIVTNIRFIARKDDSQEYASKY